jgi:hypothetical protein
MGPWASAYLPAGYTYGVEIEVAIYGWKTGDSVIMVHESDRESDDSLITTFSRLESYLKSVGGLDPGWRCVCYVG